MLGADVGLLQGLPGSGEFPAGRLAASEQRGQRVFETHGKHGHRGWFGGHEATIGKTWLAHVAESSIFDEFARFRGFR